MASLEPYIFSQTRSKRRDVSSEDNEVDNRLDKIHFANYVKEAKSLTMIILYLYSAISIAIQ